MTTSAREDPYYIVKSEIQGQVNELQATYSRWNGLRRTNPERQLLEKEMRQQLTSAEEMLALLQDALASAKRNPEKFNLTRDELSSRDHWISTTSQQVSDVKLGLDREAAAAAASGTSASGSIAPFEEETFNNSNDFIDGQRQLQRHILREQDVYLDRVDQQLVNMQELGRVMHVELDDQASMLENLDAAVDANRSRLGVVMRKTTDVLNRMSMRCQILTIIVLSAAIIGLGVVAFG